MTKKPSKPNPNQKAFNSTSLKYEKILNKIVQELSQEIPEEMEIIERYELAVNAWNLASVYRNASEPQQFGIVKDSKFSVNQQIILNKMVAYILEQWPDDRLFIDAMEVLEIEPRIRIYIKTIENEEFIVKMAIDQFEKGLEEKLGMQVLKKDYERRMINEELDRERQQEFEEDLFEMGFEEGFINRTALIIQPLKPFLDWANYADPEFIKNKQPNKLYLVHEDEIEAWLKSNYDRIFEHELGNCDIEGENWPANRSYDMFKKWFSVETSRDVFDLSGAPLFKGF